MKNQDEEMTDKMQLPRWQSHKKVWADKIVGVAVINGDVTWHLSCGAQIAVSNQLLDRVPKLGAPSYREELTAMEALAKPALGGYYVRYEDGYESWSPAKAFEEGYTRLE